jgi:uncharacterized protein (TIGR02145 family)
MKKTDRIWIYPLIIIGLVLILPIRCEKKEESVDKIADADGNKYTTVKIGTRIWMAENLKTTRYSNGDLIGSTNPATLDISSESTPKYQWAYDGNESNATTYGRLYTWYVVSDSRNVCPTGWHVPADAEWTTLTDYLTDNNYGYGGSGDQIAKSLAATTDWSANETAGNAGNDLASNNSSGFTALPGGYRFAAGTFTNVGFYGIWWSATEYNAASVWSRTITSYSSYVTRSNYSEKPYGFSVRCIKDN